MNVLIVGSGGREHALAWRAAQSPRLRRLFVAPGNAGTAQVAENVPIPAEDSAALVRFAHEKEIGLAIIGPEIPLSLGLSDSLREAGICVFGPSRAAAQIESSKAFSKGFMARHGIPTAHYRSLTDLAAALDHVRRVEYRVVIKASGLAAGKGVLIPESLEDAENALKRVIVEREFGDAGDEVVVEERLQGEEVSLLAFTDGVTLQTMPPARDHKRLRDHDEGPNTGGMGAYAPAPLCPPALATELTRTILQPTIDGMRAEGFPFVGVLYAGLMLTADGPRVLEFNCRFGDPETQALIPLLDSDLIDIAEACATGHLAETAVRWKAGAAACVILASEGYPDKPKIGMPIEGLQASPPNATIFHSGTRRRGDRVETAGGRVLGVTGWGETLDQAIQSAYAAVDGIHFEGMQYRRDIGASLSYASAGVDINAGNRAVELMREAVRSTYGPEVVAGIGSFGGMYSGNALQKMRDPVLVASTDGVGTKVKLGAEARRYASLGHDIVNHCINDILVQGARPLFFLDYIASSKLNPEMIAEIVRGMAEACRDAGCALLGGETAEMPGVYAEGAFDIVGTIIGVVEHARSLPRADLAAGDLLIGLTSSGPHTNGYSLIRKVFEGIPLDTVFPELNIPLADAFLAPHRPYLRLLSPLLDQTDSPIKALAHITGGGVENIARVLPNHLNANIRTSSYPVSPVFQLIQSRGRISTREMHRVFNMGIGMVMIAAAQDVHRLRDQLGEPTYVIGELVPGNRQVILDGE